MKLNLLGLGSLGTGFFLFGEFCTSRANPSICGVDIFLKHFLSLMSSSGNPNINLVSMIAVKVEGMQCLPLEEKPYPVSTQRATILQEQGLMDALFCDFRLSVHLGIETLNKKPIRFPLGYYCVVFRDEL